MQLLSSNAYNILWIGRYLARIQFWCKCVPVPNDAQAKKIATAFYLPANDADTLNALVLDPEQLCSFNQLFHSVYDNIQALRGVLSNKSYAELNAYFKHARNNADSICDAVNEFEQILEGESEDLFLFFSTGQTVERLDHALRLGEPLDELITIMDQLVQLLGDYDWQAFQSSWQSFKAKPDNVAFFGVVQQLQRVFEITV